MIVILCLNHFLQYGKVQAAPYKMASEMGLEAFQISTCYKMAGHGKMISYKMTHRSYMGLEAYHFRKEISTGMHKAIFTPSSFCTQIPLHTDTFTRRSLVTVKLCHIGPLFVRKV